jgi:hypothetical protein
MMTGCSLSLSIRAKEAPHLRLLENKQLGDGIVLLRYAPAAVQ